MADSALAVVKAAIVTLTNSGAVSALVGSRIYTDVPQKAQFPYVVISIQSEPFAANDFSGQSHQLRIQSFSRAAGISECLAIRKAALDALDRQEGNIAMTGSTLVKCEYSGLSDAFIEDDGKTWQSVGELEVVVV